jgi:hypothetical protein
MRSAVIATVIRLVACFVLRFTGVGRSLDRLMVRSKAMRR